MPVALALLLACGLAAAQTVILYSHLDAYQAQRAYSLAAAVGPAWMDSALSPGVQWQQEVSRRICSAERVLVMWSAAAASSAEVARELALAQVCGVPAVPVVLDHTPVPAGLAVRQWVEWR